MVESVTPLDWLYCSIIDFRSWVTDVGSHIDDHQWEISYKYRAIVFGVLFGGATFQNTIRYSFRTSYFCDIVIRKYPSNGLLGKIIRINEDIGVMEEDFSSRVERVFGSKPLAKRLALCLGEKVEGLSQRLEEMCMYQQLMF